ncbi:MAG: TIGR04372 family glycosyltransferase [Alphaproteobacteria bacterium]|nr:TIGR04372 family glycosyltransferase [Alphaproteobacteria bacterium]
MIEASDPARVAAVREAMIEAGGIAAAIPLLQECAIKGNAGALATVVEAASGLGDLGPVVREALYLLHQVFPVPVALEAVRRLAPLTPQTEAVQNDLGFLLNTAGDRDGTSRAFATAARALEARVATHPLAASGLRIIHPNWLIGSLGELAIRLGALAKLKALGLTPPWQVVLPAPQDKIVNEPFLDLFAPYVTIVKDGDMLAKFQALAPDLALDTTTIPLRDGRFLYLQEAWREAEIHWSAAGRSPLLSLSADRIAAGRALLTAIGLAEDDWFVALHVRDPGFHGAADGRRRQDMAMRDSDLLTYLPALERVVSRGGKVVRLGAPAAVPLPAMPGVIDYAHSSVRSAELDLVLIASARMMIGTMSGPAHVASCLGTPTVHANAFAGTLHGMAADIWLPKLYREQASGRILTLEESISPPFRGEMRGSGFADHGIELVDNSAEDIAAATDEMLDRLDGRALVADPAVEEIYRRTGTLYPGPISASFLARHRATLLAPR